MTRSRAHRLNFEVRSFLMLQPNIHEDGMLLKSCDVLLLGSVEITSNEPWFMQSTGPTSSNNMYMHKNEFT